MPPSCDATEGFRHHLPNTNDVRFTSMRAQNAHEYAQAFQDQKNPPWLYALWQHWKQLLQEPFKGVTNDGRIRPGLFTLQDEEVPIDEIVEAAQNMVSQLNEVQTSRLFYHVDSPEWRTWSNPEFLLSDKGVRLDECDDKARQAVLNVLKKSLSPEGYDKAIAAMRINGFLGELVNAPTVCNQYSYNFVIFGVPSVDKPWGYSFYGHHLCLNLFFYRTQVVISPWFTGAEPNVIDTGPYSGTTILQNEERLGLTLMQSLSDNLQRHAQIHQQMKDAQMPPGRWNRDDQRHLCGAYRDNRVVPYEGIIVSTLSEDQKLLVEQILHEYLLYLPYRARQVRLEQAKSYFDETYFCWIGGFSDDDAFYYRIQSPVIIVEFDHHSGVFLTNREPARFHIHTLLRTPNGGDYGKALIPLIPTQEQSFVWAPENNEKETAQWQGHQAE